MQSCAGAQKVMAAIRFIYSDRDHKVMRHHGHVGPLAGTT